MKNSLNPSYSLIAGLEDFDKDDVDITLDIDAMAPKTEDEQTSEREDYESDKEVLDENFETAKDIENEDQDNDGDNEIADNSLVYNTTRYDTLRYYRSQKIELLGHLDTIDRIIKLHSKGTLGEEGFFDIVKKALTGIVNIFGHIIHLMGTTVFRGWRDFKRGEMMAYSDSNRLTMTRLYQTDIYPSIANTMVEHPKGLQGNFSKALGTLDMFLQVANMSERASVIEDFSKALLKDSRKMNTTFASTIKNASLALNNRDMTEMFHKTEDFFTDKSNSRCQFGKLFENQSEYEYTVKLCMQNDVYLRTFASVHSKLQNTEENFTELLDTNYRFDNNELTELSKLVRTFAESFDMYGVAIQDHMRCDHNLVIITQTIRRALRM